jgi:hypothetical protein
MHKRLWVILLAVIVAVAVTVILLLHGNSTKGSVKITPSNTVAARDSAPSVPSQPTTMPKINVAFLERTLNDPDPKVEATALATKVRSAFLSAGGSVLPTGVTLAIDPTTFKTEGDNAVVEAKTSDGQRYILRLLRENGDWLIFYTMEV